jgi:hypothetical protein
LVPFEAWNSALEGSDWINVGARSSHYPADARALVKWVEPLRKWVEENRQPVQGLLTAEDLAELANKNS